MFQRKVIRETFLEKIETSLSSLQEEGVFTEGNGLLLEVCVFGLGVSVAKPVVQSASLVEGGCPHRMVILFFMVASSKSAGV